MPNGESKNWIRFLMTLEGFYALHGHWLTVIRLYPFFIIELQDKLSIEDFQKLQSKIRLEPDEDHPFLSIDEVGNSFDYRMERMPDKQQKMRAIDWLEICEPDYDD